GYLLNSKAFRVFNNQTRIVEENLHVRFSENTLNNVGIGPNWMFDIDALTKTMNCQLVVAQSNDFLGTQASNGAGKEKEPERDYILLPLWTVDSPFSSTSKSSQDNEFQPSNDGAKRVDKDLSKENECNDQGEEDSTNITNRVNIVTSNINATSSSEVNAIGINISIDLPPDLNISSLEDIGIFKDSHDDKDVFGAEADFHNLDSTFQVSPIPTTRIHKDHPIEQVIGDLHSAPQTRRMIKNLEEHGLRVDKDLSKENECNDQWEEDSTNITNRVNTVTSNINAASSSEVNAIGINISIDLPPDLNISSLEDIGIIKDSHDDKDIFGAEADFHNLDSTFQVSPIPTTSIHKDHPIEQVIGDLHSAPQTRRMIKNLEEHGLVGIVIPRTDNKDLQNCLFACLLSQMKPKKVLQALKDPSWIEAMQEELL
nr:hypothetical protein [Tanacetum cinerariifolium]